MNKFVAVLATERDAVLADGFVALHNGFGGIFLSATAAKKGVSDRASLSALKEISGMPDAIRDRRVGPRYPLILLAEITDLVSATKFTARTSDVSRGGCYIDMLNPLPQGTKIHVKLQQEKETFESGATVIYVSPGLGIGVAFSEDLSGVQQALLERWLSAAAKANP